MLANSGIIFIYNGPTNLPPEVVALMERGQLRRLPDKVDETWLPSPVRVVKVNLLRPRNAPASVKKVHGKPRINDSQPVTTQTQSKLLTTNYQPQTNSRLRRLGYAFIALSLGGMLAPLSQQLRLEATYLADKTLDKLYNFRNLQTERSLPQSVPVIFDPLITPDGASINPVNTDFSVIIPKVGVNAPVIARVNPANPGEYNKALEKGVAHASTSYFPDENGTVYLFSHSTNYDWFVKDLNAVFYLLKNLDTGDLIVVYYKNVRYTYKLREKQVVKPTAVSYLAPQLGSRNLILQTCWPPGSISERLLIFADLLEEQDGQI